MSSPNSFRQRLIGAFPLLIITLVSVVFIVIVHQLTKDKINENEQRAALAIINEVLPADYDNDIFNDKLILNVPSYINPSNKLHVYRARLNNEIIALGLIPISTKGYNGQIKLIIGIRSDDRIQGVRILRHNETEGFGDQAHQDKSDWLLGFDTYSLGETKKKDWAIKKEGGEFDQLSGATITSRNIINIIYKTLNYYKENREKFYE